MGAVFQVFPAHDLFCHGEKLLLGIDPPGLDGGLAGNRVEQLVPDGVLAFPAAGQKVGGQAFHSFGGVIRA